MVLGYKAFNADLTCKGKQYKVGKTYTEEGKLVICEHGMHFCERLVDCFNFYDYDPNNTRVAEVIAHGNVLLDDEKIKSCTDVLEVVRELPWDEVIKLCNTGSCNTGSCNTGNWNTGNWNTGNWNTGNWNTGNWNTGNWNTGSCNTGSCNTGNWNTGNWNTGNRNTGNRNTGSRNTGNWNTGNWNTGDWNSIDRSAGVFNTETGNVRMFNKQSDWTFSDWRMSDANYILRRMPQKEIVEWINDSNMTNEEKAEHPMYKATGGYIKVYAPAQTAQMWWDDLNANDKATVMALPNFDADVFEKCTGIRVEDSDETD